MRHRLFAWLAIAAFLAGCAQREEGPTPVGESVNPDVICNEQIETWIEVTGEKFTPTVVDALTDDPKVALPKVWLTRSQALDGSSTPDAPIVLNEDPTDPANGRVRWTNQSTLAFLVDPALGLEQGVYDVGIENPTGGETVLSLAFAVVAPPSVSGAVPTPICSAQYANEVTITGENFLVIDGELPTVTIGGVDFTPTAVDGCEVVAEAVRDLEQCTTLVVEVGIDAVPTGEHDVVVTNPPPAHCSSTEEVTLHVLPPPAVEDIEPQPVCVEQSDRQLTITGSDFLVLSGQYPVVTIGGVAVTVDDVTGCDPVPNLDAAWTCTAIEVTVAEGSLAPGAHQVVVTNPETAQCSSEEDVTLSVVPPPSLTSVEPQPVCNEQDDDVLILTGTGFLVIDGAVPTVTIGDYEAVDVQAPESSCTALEDVTGVLTCTELLVTVPMGTLEPGVHDVRVTNPDPAGCQSTEDVTLTVVPPPSITSLDPAIVCIEDSAMSVVITGSGFLVVGSDIPTVTVGDEPIVDVAVTDTSCVELEGLAGVSTCTEIVIVIPQNSFSPEGSPFDVVVTNPEPAPCSSNAAPLEVVYGPEVTSVEPSSICTGGGIFTIHGSNLFGISAYLDDGEGGIVNPSNISVADDGLSAQIAFAGGLTPGVYDLYVEGLGGCGEMLSGAITVNVGPIVFYFDPPAIYNEVAIRATVYASGVTEDPGAVTLVPSGGGDEVELVDVAWSADKPNRIFGTVPSGLDPGWYDLFLRDVGGCDAVLNDAVLIVSETTLALLDPALEPAFGEQETNVAVSVFAKADADLVDPEVNFQPTPRVYLSSADLATAEPLKAVVFETSARLSAVVPPLPEGVYDLVVVNPDATVGFQAEAYRATAVAPPTIIDVQPSMITSAANQAIEIQGSGFASSAVTVYCSDGSSPGVVIDSETPTLLNVTLDAQATQNGAACIVRVDNTSNDTFDEWSALSVTNPAGNMSAFTYGADLAVGRRAPAVAAARVTWKARYLYAIGGDTGAPSDALDTVEVASLDGFGMFAEFRTLTTTLPAGRTLAEARALGGFLYLIGGAVGGGGAPTSEILRAELLHPLDAPDVTDVDVRFSANEDGLEAGSWTYRVAAVFAADDDHNPGGESLPGEPVTLYAPDVPGGVEVELAWPTVYGADGLTPAAGYRIYRTLEVNGTAADLRLLDEVAAVAGDTQVFLDENPADFEDANRLPLAVGALGEWHVFASLNTPRAAYGFAAAEQSGCTARWYVFGGQTDAATESLTYEVLDVSAGEVGAVGQFTAAGTISARRQHASWIADLENSTATGLAACEFYFYVGPGLSGASTAESTVRVARYSGAAGGELAGFAQAMTAPAPVTWHGYAAFHSGDMAYSMAGTRGGAVSAAVHDATWDFTLGDPSLANWNDAASSLNQARTMFGYTRFGSFNYLVGGVDGANAPLQTAEMNVR